MSRTLLLRFGTQILTILLAISTGSLSASALDCYKDTNDHSEEMACYYRRMEKQEGMLDSVESKVVDAARRYKERTNAVHDFPRDVEELQKKWKSWMHSECDLKYSIGGGASAPSPGSEICANDMMKQRMKVLESLRREFDETL
jgi:uncharacterized protein YecT (DUF1311 family)